ncbi:hypothetical protein HK096_003557, partial [Nowakowskiella sp. JEL0078]
MNYQANLPSGQNNLPSHSLASVIGSTAHSIPGSLEIPSYSAKLLASSLDSLNHSSSSQFSSLPDLFPLSLLPPLFSTGYLVYIPWLPINTSPQHLFVVLISVLHSLKHRTNGKKKSNPVDYVLGKDFDCRLFIRPETNCPFAMLAFEKKSVAVSAIPKLRRKLLSEINDVIGKEISGSISSAVREHRTSSPIPEDDTSATTESDLSFPTGTETTTDTVSIGSIDSRGTEVIACFAVDHPDEILSKRGPIHNLNMTTSSASGDESSTRSSSENNSENEDPAPTGIKIIGLPSVYSLSSLVEQLSSFGEIVDSRKRNLMSTPTFVGLSPRSISHPTSPGPPSDYVDEEESNSNHVSESQTSTMNSPGKAPKRQHRRTKSLITSPESTMQSGPFFINANDHGAIQNFPIETNNSVDSRTSPSRNLLNRLNSPTDENISTNSVEFTNQISDSNFAEFSREFPRRKHTPRNSISSQTPPTLPNNFISSRNSFILSPGVFSPFLKQIPSFSQFDLNQLQANCSLPQTFMMRSDVTSEAHITFKHSHHAARAVVGLHGA